ncbi:MAG: hypothetical protein IJQ73_17915 [Kiritimatiellae bacterium]|nr:hypothetical protein [Kiritimatiellia bacterium]
MRRTFPILLLACAALADPVPVRFNADAAAPQTFQAAAYRGETLDIVARLTLRGAPLAVADGASATMHWQTNGMGTAWWTAPASVTTSGLVRARWTPAMDCGADAYRVFLGVADGGSNLSYRANMLLRMVGSPGETPNALPLPVQVLDFAKIAWTNAPWGDGGGIDGEAVTGIVERVVADATNAIPRGVAIDLRGDGSETVRDAALSGTAYTEWDIYGELPDGQLTYGLRLLFDEIAQHEAFSGRYPARTNIPVLPASATVGELVDAINAVATALRKEEP